MALSFEPSKSDVNLQDAVKDVTDAAPTIVYRVQRQKRLVDGSYPPAFAGQLLTNRDLRMCLHFPK